MQSETDNKAMASEILRDAAIEYITSNHSPMALSQGINLFEAGANWQQSQYKPLVDSHKELIAALNILLSSHYKLSGGLIPTDEEKYCEQIIEKAKKINIQ